MSAFVLLLSILFGFRIRFLLCINQSLLYASELQLKKQLFDPQVYDKSIRPGNAENGSTVITMDFALDYIVKCDLREEAFTFLVVVRFWWNDPRLVWKKDEFGGIEEVAVNSRSFWVPDVVVDRIASGHNFYETLPSNTPGRLKANGDLYFSRLALITVACPMNIANFPVDKQECGVRFGPWSYKTSQMALVPKMDHVNLENHVKHSELDILQTRVAYTPYELAVGTFSSLTYFITFSRNPLYYINNFVIPCLLIEMISTLVFLLPNESGEKVALLVSLTLSICFLLLVLQDTLPVNSKNTPLLTMYFFKSLALVVGVFIATVFVLNLHFNTERTLPRWMQTLVDNYLAKIVCMKKPFKKNSVKANGVKVNYKDEARSGSNAALLASIVKELRAILVHLEEKEKIDNDEVVVECQFIAKVFDRLFFFLFFTFSLTSNIGIIMHLVIS